MMIFIFSFRLQNCFFHFGIYLLLIPLVQACGINSPTLTNNIPTQNPVASSNITVKNTAYFSSTPTLKSIVPIGTTITANNTNTLSWQLDWLKGVPCQPPCWEGIIPNVTSATKALKILNQNSLIKNATIDSNSKSSVIQWDWTDIPKSNDALYFTGGSITYDVQTPNQPVVYIAPIYKDLTISLSNVIKVFGEPDYILAEARATDTEFIYSLNIVYSAKGFALYDSWVKKPIVNSDLTFSNVVFFTPTINGYLKTKPVYEQKGIFTIIVNWQGFNSFNFYCRNLPGSYDDCANA